MLLVLCFSFGYFLGLMVKIDAGSRRIFMKLFYKNTQNVVQERRSQNGRIVVPAECIYYRLDEYNQLNQRNMQASDLIIDFNHTDFQYLFQDPHLFLGYNLE